MIAEIRRRIAFVLACGLLSGVAVNGQGTVTDGVPDRIDAAARYVIYLHGRIIEDQGRRPTHETWGVYEYDRVLEALSSGGTAVISEQRPPATDMDRFADRVVDQVRQLQRAGVPPGRISVVGFSKGGGIAIRASALLKDARVNFVFLAACGDGDFSAVDIAVHGRMLSIYEATDEGGRSCASLFAKPGTIGERAETRIDTGEGHGAFYRPRREWLIPVSRWLEGR